MKTSRAERHSIMTERIKKRIMTIVSRMVDDGSVRGLYPKTMFECGNILCFQDYNIIDIGSEYTSIRGHGNIAKYFHRSCYERMFH